MASSSARVWLTLARENNKIKSVASDEYVSMLRPSSVSAAWHAIILFHALDDAYIYLVEHF